MKAIAMFAVFLFACDSENTTKTFNDNPTISIMSHSDGFEALEGEVISFRAQVSDTNDNISELLVAWYQGQELVCDWAVPFEEGDSYCDITIGALDSRIIAEVQDPSGAAGRSEIELLVTPNEAPTAQILSPAPADRFYSDQLISFHAFVADLEDSPEALLLQWESSVDGELVVASVADSNGDATGAGYLSEGQHSLQLHVTDTMGKSVTESLVLQVGGANSAPSCEILSPADETGVSLGEGVNFRGQATDPDVDSSQLTYIWKSDKDGDLGTGTISSDGSIYFSYADLTAATHAISLEVSDEVGESCSDIIFLSVGTAPVVNVLSPVSGDLFQVGESISFDATISDSDELPSQLLLSWVSDIDGEFSDQATDSNGNISFNKSILSAGSHSVTLTAADSSGLTTTQAIDFMINTPPSVPSVSLTPISPDTNNTLLVMASGSSDADGHNISYSYQWYLNGNVTANTSSAITSTDTTKGEVWTVRVTPNDGYHDGQYTEASVAIINSAPALSGVTISPAAPSNLEQLTCTASSSDADGETLVETITWSNLTTGATLGMGASLQLSSGIAVNGDVIQCAVEVADSDTSVSAATTVTVINTAPEFTSAAEILPSSGVTTSSALTCSGVAIDTDGSLPTLTYAWENLSSAVSLGSSASLSLTPSNSSPTDIIQCSITATDADGESVASSASVQVSNSFPTVDSVEISPASGVTTADSVSCTATTSDADGEQLSLSFSWSNASTGVVLGAGATLSLSPAMIQPGESLECLVSVSDGYGGTDTQSTALVIANTPPVIASVSISPANPYNDDSLNCAVSASDADGQSLAASVNWVNASTGAGLGTGASLTLSSAAGMPGETIECTVSVDDGAGGSASLSSSVILGNRAPDLPVLAISPNPATSLDTLECVLSSATDPDGDSVTPAYAWYVNSILDPSEAAATFGGNFASGDTVSCTVITSDGSQSSAMGSATITVVNNPPVVNSVSLTPDPLRTDEPVTATVTASDTDGDAISLEYQWSVNGAVVQTVSTSSLTDSLANAYYVRGNVVSVTVTPSDANAVGAPAIAGLTVDNTAPTAAAVSLSPANPVEGLDDVVCTASSSTDADGDTVSYNFTWTVDGAAFNGALSSGSASTVAASHTFAGELWQCTATPNDGLEDGASASISVTINSDWDGLRSFSTCTATGRIGPSQSQCDSAYAGSTLNAEVSVSSGIQEWVVPADGDYVIEAAGAAGGEVPGYPSTRGGYGATMLGVFSLSQGDVLSIVVGQQGSDETNTGYGGGGGGGGSFVYTGSISGSGLMIAAGGGAGEPEDNAFSGPDGSTSNAATNNCGSGIGHGGGSYLGGGGGAGWLSTGTTGSSGSGASGGGQHWNGGTSGGGGSDNVGGFGGGGGANDNESGGGGGYSGGCGSGDNGVNVGAGGSYNDGASQSNTGGSNTGHGYVTIDKL